MDGKWSLLRIFLTLGLSKKGALVLIPKQVDESRLNRAGRAIKISKCGVKEVCAQQPARFFEPAEIDVDGTIAPTSGECKEGMEISYNGHSGAMRR